ncbi:MAG TPA: thiolase family protein [Mycobacteriales bacterium]|nr:thiolase family protein [Mycobacteriales bacterium]
MRNNVIVAGARTPIARGRKGGLVSVDAFELARVVVPEVISRSGVDAADIDDIVLAENMQGGGVIARHTAVSLGLTSVPGMSVNRHCAAGQVAVQTAVGQIRAGAADVVIAGGTESMSTMPFGVKMGADGSTTQWMPPSHPNTAEAPAFDMAITVGENTARLAGLTRRDVDEWAAYTHGQAIASQDAGSFDDEIVPVTVTNADGTTTVVSVDEHPRRGVTVESLGELKLLHPEIEGATVTAGNAAGVNDAAAALMVTSEDYANSHGLAALGSVVSWANVGVDPVETGLAPIIAIEKALGRAGLSIGDIDLWEINEAFCAVPVAVTRKLGIDTSIVNVNGSGASLGHPIAATGARMIVTMLGELRRRDKSVGVVSMCAGGGMGAAMVLELR